MIFFFLNSAALVKVLLAEWVNNFMTPAALVKVLLAEWVNPSQNLW